MHPSDHPVISERYFFPRSSQPPTNAVMLKVAPDVELGCSHFDYGHQHTVLHFHGNGEIVGDYLPSFPQMMDELGMNTFLAEYRGYGASSGIPQLGAMQEDVAAISEVIGDPSNLIAFGRSIGSIYAIEFVRRFPSTSGLILESGIANVLERILLRASPEELGVAAPALRQAFVEKFDHATTLRHFKGKSLVLHAKGDHLVEVSHAQQNAAALGEECKLVILPRGDHNSIFSQNRETYLSELGKFAHSIQEGSSAESNR